MAETAVWGVVPFTLSYRETAHTQLRARGRRRHKARGRADGGRGGGGLRMVSKDVVLLGVEVSALDELDREVPVASISRMLQVARCLLHEPVVCCKNLLYVLQTPDVCCTNPSYYVAGGTLFVACCTAIVCCPTFPLDREGSASISQLPLLPCDSHARAQSIALILSTAPARYVPPRRNTSARAPREVLPKAAAARPRQEARACRTQHG